MTVVVGMSSLVTIVSFLSAKCDIVMLCALYRRDDVCWVKLWNVKDFNVKSWLSSADVCVQGKTKDAGNGGEERCTKISGVCVYTYT